MRFNKLFVLAFVLVVTTASLHAQEQPTEQPGQQPVLPPAGQDSQEQQQTEPPFQNITQAAKSYTVRPLTVFGQAVSAAGLDAQLNQPNLAATILAPSNTAFANFLKYINKSAEETFANQTLLREILSYHVIPNVVLTSDNVTQSGEDQQELPTLLGEEQKVTVKVSNESLSNDDSEQSSGLSKITFDDGEDTAEVEYPDIVAGQSVIHVIDRVLMNEKLRTSLQDIAASSTAAGGSQTDATEPNASGDPTVGGRKLLFF